MILSNVEIRQVLADGAITVDPAPGRQQYSPTALDLRLGDTFHHWNQRELDRMTRAGIDYSLDISRVERFSEVSDQYLAPAPVDAEGCYLLRPGNLVLGITYEWVHLTRESGIAARVEGRSSLARMGLVVHLTAPTIHAGWDGKIALEIVNLGPWPLKLRPRELRICQLVFERVGELPEFDAPTQFQGQETPSG